MKPLIKEFEDIFEDEIGSGNLEEGTLMIVKYCKVTFTKLVKEKMDWILEEIDKKINKLKNLEPTYQDYGDHEAWFCPVCGKSFECESEAYEHVASEVEVGFPSVEIRTLRWVKNLIKKTFGD